MSNELFIQQEEVKVRHSGDTREQVSVHDNCGSVILDLDEVIERGEFVDDHELLLWGVIRAAKEQRGTVLRDMIDNALSGENAVVVDGFRFSSDRFKEECDLEGYCKKR